MNAKEIIKIKHDTYKSAPVECCGNCGFTYTLGFAISGMPKNSLGTVTRCQVDSELIQLTGHCGNWKPIEKENCERG